MREEQFSSHTTTCTIRRRITEKMMYEPSHLFIEDTVPRWLIVIAPGSCCQRVPDVYGKWISSEGCGHPVDLMLNYHGLQWEVIWGAADAKKSVVNWKNDFNTSFDWGPKTFMETELRFQDWNEPWCLFLTPQIMQACVCMISIAVCCQSRSTSAI